MRLPIDQVETIPPLHQAALTGDVAAATALLKAGVSPDEPVTVTQRQRTHTGFDGEPYSVTWSPLHTAVERGQVAVARLLLEYGANRDSPGPDNATPLHLAAQAGNREMVEVLLSYGAKRDAQR